MRKSGHVFFTGDEPLLLSKPGDRVGIPWQHLLGESTGAGTFEDAEPPTENYAVFVELLERLCTDAPTKTINRLPGAVTKPLNEPIFDRRYLL